MTRRPKCKNTEHDDRRMRGGRMRCAKCGDVFPCRKPCPHVDCAIAAGRPLPDGITTKENP